MRVDIGNRIEFEFNSSEITLPKVAESYYLIREITGRGQLIEAHFKYDTDKVFFLFELDGENFMELDVDKYNSFAGFKGKDDSFADRHSVIFNEDEKILHIKFSLPIQYQNGLKFYTKSNDGNKAKKLEGFNIIINRETE